MPILNKKQYALSIRFNVMFEFRRNFEQKIIYVYLNNFLLAILMFCKCFNNSYTNE